jgi:hypothetical protein
MRQGCKAQENPDSTETHKMPPFVTIGAEMEAIPHGIQQLSSRFNILQQH